MLWAWCNDHKDGKQLHAQGWWHAGCCLTIRIRSVRPDCNTRYGTHHLNFGGRCQSERLDLSGSEVIGLIDTKVYDDDTRRHTSPGLVSIVLDTNAYCTITRPWN